MRRCLVLTLLLLLPVSGSAYFRLQGQVTAPAPVLRSGRRSSVEAKETQLQKTRRQILELTNAERAKKKLPPLARNAVLERAAQMHAEDMVRRKYFSHKNRQGKTPSARIRDAGYFVPPCAACAYSFNSGENIAKGQKTSAEVMRSWMASPVHRENILRVSFKELGIGYKDGVWVQNFGGIQKK